MPGVGAKADLQVERPEGRNLLFESRFDDRVDRLAALATELVVLKPDVITVNGTQAAIAAQQATKSIPIVMMASNPVGNGLVETLARRTLRAGRAIYLVRRPNDSA